MQEEAGEGTSSENGVVASRCRLQPGSDGGVSDAVDGSARTLDSGRERSVMGDMDAGRRREAAGVGNRAEAAGIWRIWLTMSSARRKNFDGGNTAKELCSRRSRGRGGGEGSPTRLGHL